MTNVGFFTYTDETRDMNSQPQKTDHDPDPDAIKMFVGQIPRSMDENDLRKLFEEDFKFGPVCQLNVLRDKVTGQSKGCCFVTFYTRKAALDAQNALHNIKTMPGMHHPIQMKPADSEKRNEERKLFIGMLTKKYNENDVRMMFAPFGSIEDCTVLRDPNGQSRGCAFITYTNRQSAQNAIKNMHQSQTMEGCSAPLVVKFADTQKEKEAKKFQQISTNLWNLSLGGLGALGPQYLALLQQAAAAGNLGLLGGNTQNLGLNALGLQQLLAAAAAAASNNPALLPSLEDGVLKFGLLATLAGLSNNAGNPSNQLTNNNSSSNLSSGSHINTNSPGGGDGTNNLHLQNLQGLAALANNPAALNALGVQNLAAFNQMSTGSINTSTASGSLNGTTNSSNALSGLGIQALGNNSLNSLNSLAPSINTCSSMNGINSTGLSANPPSGIDALSQAYTGIQQYAAAFPNAFNNQTTAQIQRQVQDSPAGKQTEGPDGANLFIYHLPQEFTDHDLLQTFMPFGNVISSKVFIDKQTNLSKCFGFVSYDNPLSSSAAIQAMNGFQIGMKRLKVQLKRQKNDKPY